VSLPRAGAVRAGLSKLDLFVVSDNVTSNDTINAGAHLLLPAAAWGEKDGAVTNSERRISRQRAFLPQPAEARPDWWIVSQVACRMGFTQAFAYRSAADVFGEHAALSCFENDGVRDFDIGGLAGIPDAAYDALEPVQWPVPSVPHGEAEEEKRFFAAGGFFTPDRKARFIAPDPPALREQVSVEYPLRLNTGRIRDQWHTMTRSGLSPRLARHLPEPFVETHPSDAAAAGLTDGGFARIATEHGACIVRVMVSDGQRPGSLFVPIHWSAETASCARVGELVAPHTDPHSGQPEAKATPAAIAPVSYAQRGYLRARRALTPPHGTWWTRIAVADGIEHRLATNHGPLVWHDFAYRSLASDARLAERLDDRGYRAAAFVDGELAGTLCIAPLDSPPAEDTLAWSAADLADGAAMIAPASVMAETEPVVCACFQVELAALRKAVMAGARTVADIGAALRAGSNCGSCVPELKRIIARERIAHSH
jgi:assimilatory nitrate reductase catalytic subunit